jgi:predicted dehydrogenase
MRCANQLRSCADKSSDNPLRFGLVGAGGIAQAYVKAFEHCGDARLVAVADTRRQAAEALSAGIGCHSYGSHEEMGAACPLDAVIVCTPPVTHFGISVYFLGRKIHVLCEKPLSIELASANTMLLTAEENGVILTMASKFRYAEDVVRAREFVQSGLIGDMVLVENVFTSYVDMSKRWNSDPAVSGGGVLIDNGTHAVDIMRYFLGPLTEVDVIEGKRSQNLQVEETVRVFVRSREGVLGNIDLSWSTNSKRESFLDIHGSKGVISVGWRASGYRLSSSPEWVVFGKGYDKAQAFKNQLSDFVRAVRGEDSLIPTAEDVIASVRVIETSYIALRERRWVTIRHRPVRPKLERETEASQVRVHKARA